jgi:D-alanyl-D-alanine carboxypeptidase
MSVLALAVLLAAVDPRVETVLKAVGEPGCPRLFPMLSDSFRKAVPAAQWPSWCAFVGVLEDLESRPDKDGWLRFRGRSKGKRILFDVAFDGAGKVSGLMAVPDDTLPEAERKVTLPQKLEQVRQEFGLPSLSALVLRDGRVTEIAAVGVRKLGDPTPVTADDRWHLGSDTKAMTATLAAMLVDEKRLRWDSTVGEVLGDWKDIHPDFRPVTLEMLLAHRGGVPAKSTPAEWSRMWDARDQHRQRRETVHNMLRAAPEKVGAFLYSNFGYLVADAMMEKVSGLPWETAIRQRLFQPLKMESCGFGGPASPGKIDQPWAHQTRGEKLVPMPPGPQSDNPPSLGPAGTVHCGLRDWARFAQLHLDGGRGGSPLVTPASMRRLHTPPPGGDYALGWATGSYKSHGQSLAHDGSNTLYFARAWLLPAKNAAFLIVTNAAGERATNAIGQVLSYLRGRDL